MKDIYAVDMAPVYYSDTKKCPECGRRFRFTTDWGYRIGCEAVCSYHCMRQAEAARKAGTRKRNQPMTAEEKAEALNFAREHPEATLTEIAEHIGKPYETVRNLLVAHGVKPAKYVRKRPDYRLQEEEIRAARERGETWREIADRLRRDPHTVRDWYNGLVKKEAGQ